MKSLSKRSTVYLDPSLHQALRIKSAETSRSMSELINDSLREAFSEDLEDLAAFEERADESLISYEQIIKRLKKDGRI